MFGTFSLCPRLLFVFVLVCVAVMSFIMCSDAAKASPITVEHGVKHNVLRSSYAPYRQSYLFSTGQLSTETPPDSETEINQKLSDKGNWLIIDGQSKPLLFTKSKFSHNQSPDNSRSQAGITGFQGSPNTGDTRPANSIFISYPEHRVQSSRVNYQPLSHKVAQTGSPYHLSPAIIRKSSHREAASPFHQRSSLLQSWDPKDAHKSYDEEKVIRIDSPSVAGEDRTVWQSSDSSLFSSKTGGYQSGSLPTSRGHYGGHHETNEHAVARAWSSGIQSRKFHSFATQTAPYAPSVSKSLDTSVIKRNPSPEKLRTSITDFSQGLYSVSSSETPRLRKVQPYLFKDSQASLFGRETVNTVTEKTASGLNTFSTTPNTERVAKVYSRLPLNFKPQLHRRDPAKEDNTNTKVAVYGGQTDSFIKYQPISSIYLSQHTTAQTPARASLTMESFVPVPLEDFQDNYATGGDKSRASSLIDTTTRWPAHGYKPGRSTKSIYGFRGFKMENKRIHSSSGTDGKANSGRCSFDNVKDHKSKSAYPSLLQKYSFGQIRSCSMTTTPTPAKTERRTTDFSGPGNTSPSSVRLDALQTTTVPTPTLFTSGFRKFWPLVPERDVGMDSNPDRRQYRSYKRIYGLKDVGTRPLSTTTFNQVEGAKALVRESNKSALLPSFEGFKLNNSQMWRPKSSRIYRWHNQTVKNDVTATQRGNELSGEDLKPPLKTSGSTKSDPRLMPDKYKENHKIYNFPGFQSIRNRIVNGKYKTTWNHQAEQNPTPRVSSDYPRSAVDPMKPGTMKASFFNSSTSSTVRGTRVRAKPANSKKLNASTSLRNGTGDVALVRLPKWPSRVKAITNADILGSASFSGVRATTQTSITAADKHSFPKVTATTKQKGSTLGDDRVLAVDEYVGEKDQRNSEGAVHSSKNTKGPAEDEMEEFSSLEENKLGAGKKVDSEGKTSNLFLDTEGSGSAGFDLSDILSTDPTGSQVLSEDLLELDYLRISTGNVTFKSMNMSL